MRSINTFFHSVAVVSVVAALLSLTLTAARAGTSTSNPATRPLVGLYAPLKKEIAMKLVAAAENSSLDWKAQYGYIEYNVEENADENRGYTAGIIGFTSRTHDMLELVQYYQKINPKNELVKYLPILAKVDGTSSKKGLGKPFVDAWKAAAKDPKFCDAQDHERDRVYFNPAVDLALADQLSELGQFIYYDAIVMHGDGGDGLTAIRKAALKVAKTPRDGGGEPTYLNAFLDARRAAMKAEQGHQDTARVDKAQRKFLQAGNLHLELPLEFEVNNEKFTIEK